MPYPDEGLLHAWLDGELDAAAAKRVEELVASDPAWATAAAEARGLMAASSRIVRALDHVSPNVIPKSKPPQHAPRWWVARIAALVVVVAGTTIVLRQSEPRTALRQPAGPPIAADSSGRAQAPAAKAEPSPASVAAAPEKKKTLQAEAVKEALTALSRSRAEPRSDAGVTAPVPKTTGRLDSPPPKPAALENSAAPAVKAAPAAKAASRDQAASLPVSPPFKSEKDAAVRPSSASDCFQVREPANAGLFVLRFDTTQLADSLRLRKMTLRGDTLRLEAGRRLAVRVSCPDP